MAETKNILNYRKKGEEKMKDEIVVDDITYIKKEILNLNNIDNYVIVRTSSAGVHAGKIETRDGQEIVLSFARRLWYWKGASSLSQLAVDGVSDPANCKFPCEVRTITLLGVIEIIPCTQKAQQSIRGVKIWKS